MYGNVIVPYALPRRGHVAAAGRTDRGGRVRSDRGRGQSTRRAHVRRRVGTFVGFVVYCSLHKSGENEASHARFVMDKQGSGFNFQSSAGRLH